MNALEREYVHNSYQKIATDFSKTRAYLWKSVKEFVRAIPAHSIIAEIGSGNGKNLFREDCFNIAFDLCSEFTKITNTSGIDSVIANGLHVPLRDQSVDYVLCIAMLHHLTDAARRLQVIQEITRIMSPQAKLIIQVWAMKQPEKSRRTFLKQDNMVPFQNPSKRYKIDRFYHIFEEGELDKLIKQVPGLRILESFWEMGNWVIICEKD